MNLHDVTSSLLVLFPNAAPYLKEILLEGEYLDRREAKVYYVREDEFATDLKTLRGRVKLLRHVPLVASVSRLPSRDETVEQCRENQRSGRSWRQDRSSTSRTTPSSCVS